MARTLTWVAPNKITHAARPKFGTAGPRYAVIFLDCEEAVRTVFQLDLRKNWPVTCLECLAKGGK